MTRERQRTSARLRGLVIPECFVAATIATAARETYRGHTKDARRTADKVRRIVGRE